MDLKKKTSAEKWRIWAFILGVSYPVAGTVIDMMLTWLIGQNSIDTILTTGVLLVFLGMAFLNNKDCIKADVIFVFLFMMFLLALDYFNPNAIESKQALIFNGFLTKAFPAYLFVRILTDKDDIISALKYIAFIIFVFACIIPFMPMEIQNIYDSGEEYGAYMLFGYHMVPAVNIFIYLAFTENKLLYKMFALAGTIEVLIWGNRGAVVSIAIFFVAYLLLFANIKRKLVVFVTAIVTFMGYSYFVATKGVLKLYDFLISKGFNPRNLEMFLSSSLDESGRDQIYETAYDVISNNLFFGVGISASWMFDGPQGYTHNLFLELLLQFGVILGGVLIVFFLAKSIMVIFYRNSSWSKIYLIFFSTAMVKLMFSASYLTEWWFWVMMGMFVTSLTMLKREKTF